ncbi:hypothetical protein PhCBS80983_g06448 [Powellomyces hirtus]|uniref:Uncharacterized protein n=1 Tax=Powellomyces hirtus TaxID=109895 RepID=A0A507DMT8_9FUNG|nr:hypothetical protein PhCBS80983_g06448 [Powellomyces hirtus]
MKTAFGQFTTDGSCHYGSIRIPVYVAQEEVHLPAHHVTHVAAKPEQEMSPKECYLVTGSKSMQDNGIWCPNQLIKPYWDGTWLTPVANLTSNGKKLRKGQLLCWVDSEDRDFTVERVPEVHLTEPNGLRDWLMQQELPRQVTAGIPSQHTSHSPPRLKGRMTRKTVFIVDTNGETHKTQYKEPAQPKLNNLYEKTYRGEGLGQEEIGDLAAWGKDVQEGSHVANSLTEPATPSEDGQSYEPAHTTGKEVLETLELPHLDPTKQATLKRTLMRHAEAFDPKIPAKPNIPYEHHMAIMEGTRPISHPPRRTGMVKKELLRDHVNTMLKDDVIRPSRSPWAAPN